MGSGNTQAFLAGCCGRVPWLHDSLPLYRLSQVLCYSPLTNMFALCLLDVENNKIQALLRSLT